MIWVELEPDPSHRPDDTWENETISAVLEWVFLIIDLIRGAVERYEKTVVELLHRDNFNLEAIRDNMTRVTSNGEMMKESSSRMF